MKKTITKDQLAYVMTELEVKCTQAEAKVVECKKLSDGWNGYAQGVRACLKELEELYRD